MPDASPIIRCLTLLSLLLCFPAQAAIFACPTESGGKIYQDRPCEEASKPKSATSTDSTTSDANNSSSALPENMDESWFDRPELATNYVWCDRLGCECGTLDRTFQAGLKQAVADSLYLDGGWHRYSSMVGELQGTIKNSFEYQALRMKIDAAACDIMMSQNILKKYGKRKLKEIREDAEFALEKGFADPTLCDAGNEEACKHLDAYMKFEMIQHDLQTLRAPREQSTTTLSTSIDR